MPVYEYDCGQCGPFSKWRSLAECSLPAECPACGVSAVKLFPVVNLRAMSSSNRLAWARNEQSAHAPHACGAGCGHNRGTTPKKPRNKPRFSAPLKPNSRPWMLGH